MTQSESLRIKWAVTLFLLEVGYNEKIAQFLTIECLKKFFYWHFKILDNSEVATYNEKIKM